MVARNSMSFDEILDLTGSCHSFSLLLSALTELYCLAGVFCCCASVSLVFPVSFRSQAVSYVFFCIRFKNGALLPLQFVTSFLTSCRQLINTTVLSYARVCPKKGSSFFADDKEATQDETPHIYTTYCSTLYQPGTRYLVYDLYQAYSSSTATAVRSRYYSSASNVLVQSKVSIEPPEHRPARAVPPLRAQLFRPQASGDRTQMPSLLGESRS